MPSCKPPSLHHKPRPAVLRLTRFPDENYNTENDILQPSSLQAGLENCGERRTRTEGNLANSPEARHLRLRWRRVDLASSCARPERSSRGTTGEGQPNVRCRVRCNEGRSSRERGDGDPCQSPPDSVVRWRRNRWRSWRQDVPSTGRI